MITGQIADSIDKLEETLIIEVLAGGGKVCAVNLIYYWQFLDYECSVRS